MTWLVNTIKELVMLVVLIIASILWLLWQPFRHWKTTLILVLSFINVVGFLAATNKEVLYNFEFQRLVGVDNAQRFAYRALGIAEMETMRAEDMQSRLELALDELATEREWNEQLKARLDQAGIHVLPSP